jgi:NADH/F420H2 dehydrogenase subunit C
MSERIAQTEIAEQIDRAVPGAVRGSTEAFGEQTVLIARERIVPVSRWLHDEPALAYEQLSDLTAVDWPEAPERFEVVYQLNSFRHRKRLRLKARVPLSDCEIDSVTPVWRAAGFLEREVFDLFGIRFRGHPDLRRIMMPEEYDEGYPLRKDFPTVGKGWRSTFEFWPAIDPGREVKIDASALVPEWKKADD